MFLVFIILAIIIGFFSQFYFGMFMLVYCYTFFVYRHFILKVFWTSSLIPNNFLRRWHSLQCSKYNAMAFVSRDSSTSLFPVNFPFLFFFFNQLPCQKLPQIKILRVDTFYSAIVLFLIFWRKYSLWWTSTMVAAVFCRYPLSCWGNFILFLILLIIFYQESVWGFSIFP